MVARYLVKWCGLPYTECTWELAEDLKALLPPPPHFADTPALAYTTLQDDEKIARFHKWSIPPSHSNTSGRPISQWAPLNNPIFKNNNQLRKYQLVCSFPPLLFLFLCSPLV